jgi:hypothetical protein
MNSIHPKFEQPFKERSSTSKTLSNLQFSCNASSVEPSGAFNSFDLLEVGIIKNLCSVAPFIRFALFPDGQRIWTDLLKL